MNNDKIHEEFTEYLSRGQYSEIISRCEEILNNQPTETFIPYYLGLALLLQGNVIEAQSIWITALEQLSLEDIDIWVAGLIQLLETEASQSLNYKNFPLAETLYEQILELDSNNINAFYHLGIALSQQGNFEQAIECWQEATKIQDNFREAHQKQGQVFQKLEEFDQAILSYSKALEISPHSLDTLYNLGLCYSHQQNWTQAKIYFEQAIQVQPNFNQAYSDLGYALLQQGNLEQALIHFKQSFSNQTQFLSSYLQWTELLLSEQRLDEKTKINASFIKSLQTQSNLLDLNLLLTLGELVGRTGNLNVRYNIYHLATQIRPQVAKPYLKLGQILLQQNKIDEAIHSFRQALELEPEWEQAYLYLGKSLALKREFEPAIEAYEKCLHLNPKLAEIWSDIGDIHLERENFNQAIKCLKQALEIDPSSPILYCTLGMAIAKLKDINLKDKENPLDYFSQAINLNADLASIIAQIILNLQQEGYLDRETLLNQDILPVDSPKGFYETTQQWAINSNSSIYYKEIPLNENLKLSPPKTPNSTIHFSFRFGHEIELPQPFVTILPQGRYFSDHEQSTSAIITSDNLILGDLSPEFPLLSPGHPDKHPSKHSLLKVQKLPPIQKIEGTVAVLNGLLNDVYFHWLFDVLPRIQLLRLSGIDFDEINNFIVNNNYPFQEETLAVLGIEKLKIINPRYHSHIEATQLIVPSFPGSAAWMPKWTCDFLRTTFLNPENLQSSEKIERLYISRQQNQNRRLINEKEVISFLNSLGFKSVSLEFMSVREQAALLAHAKVIVAPHGSGLTNIVFCSPETKVIEIFSPQYVYPCYWLISNLVGLDYYYLLGEIIEGFHLHELLYPDSRIEDIFVNLENLSDILKFAGIQ